MITPYLRLIRVGIVLPLLIPAVVITCTWLLGRGGFTLGFWGSMVMLFAYGLTAAWWIARWAGRLGPALNSLAEAQARHLEAIPAQHVPLTIVASAGVGLFLELAVIRWQGAEWEVFAFYKNFSLLSCFLGLGLGYALARARHVPLALVLPLLVWQFGFLLALRHALPEEWRLSLRATPIAEQLNVGINTATRVPQYVAIYALLATVMLLTALAFIPLGQLCGRLLDRLPPLHAYGWNLVGSLGGVAAMFLVSFLWTPPLVWFALASLAIVSFQAFDRRALLVGAGGSVAVAVVLAWPVTFGWERIYSPYQLLERGPGAHGLPIIRAAGHYYQRVLDLSRQAQAAYPERRSVADYYELPFRLHTGVRRAAIVGAGTGNDVAAALRAGVPAMDAIEIDPAILALGALYHPERPYADPRVTRIVDDARTFFRTTPRTYDLIVYGLLDSHTLLSHTSSVRLDSYVYTIEGLRDARGRLNPDGVLSLSFAVLSDELGRKIHLMMQEAFDGRPPVSIYSKYDGAVTFAQAKDGRLAPDPAILAATGFEDRSARYADPAIRADVSTDDWPFFYMPQRVYPASYLWGVALVLVLAVLLYRAFIHGAPHAATLPFFFLGAGFMLVETKGISELGLAFGNTWQVVGIVIAAILTMAWLANWVVGRRPVRRAWMPWLLLLASLIAGVLFVRAGGIGAAAGARWVAVVLLTVPLFFSGIVFSTVFARAAEPSSALGMNLLGAMAGGVLEYNSMYFGFQSLYWLAAALYGTGLVSFLLFSTRAGPAPA